MVESTPVVAFDQHAASVVAAVLLPGQRTPALHALPADLPAISRFVERLRLDGSGVVTKPGRAGLSCSGICGRAELAVM
jgi:hypothetical protein